MFIGTGFNGIDITPCKVPFIKFISLLNKKKEKEKKEKKLNYFGTKGFRNKISKYAGIRT